MEGNNIQTITKTSPSFFSKNKGKILKGGAGLLGAAALIGASAAMGAPAATAPVFGVKGFRTGRSLLGRRESVFRKLNPESKPIKVQNAKHKSIKTAKPTKINVDKAERAEVLNKYYGVGDFKPGTSLKQKEGFDKPLGFKDISRTGKTRLTKTGKKMDKQKQPLTVFDRAQANKAILDELEKTRKENTLKLFR